MQTSTLVILACLVAVVVATTDDQPLQQQYEEVYGAPEIQRGERTKRGLLLLKKKLLLGALGLKAAKVGAVGAGVVGAVALKKKSRPSKYVEVQSWSG